MTADAVIYLTRPSDVSVAQLPVAGRPVVFRAVAAAVRGGAARVLVPAAFREVLLPALSAAPRVARAITWLAPTTPLPAGALLIPATVVLGPGAVGAMLAAPAPAVHATARDAGVPLVLASAALLATMWSALTRGAPVADVVAKAVAVPAAVIVRDAALVHAVRDAASAAVAERRLYTTLGSAIDTPLDTAFHRRFSRLVSRMAVARGITPNAVTLSSLFVGILAAWSFWDATPVFAGVGLVLYAAAVILDHADGEIARLTLTESAIGEWLDIAADTVTHVAVVVALGMTSQALTGRGAGFGVLAALGFVVSAAAAKAWPGGLGNRDGFYAMLLAFIAARAAWIDALPWLMVLVAAGSHVFWVSRVLRRLRRGA